VDIKKIVVLFSGYGSTFEYLIENLMDAKIVLGITNNPDANGIKIAKKYNIPTEIINSSNYHNREEFDEKIVDVINKHNPDLVVLAGFMRILTPVFTNNIKAVNLHPSLLPMHKGTNAIEKSFDDEYRYGGVSVHYVTSELDGGEIILQRSICKDGLSYEEYYKQIKEIEKIALREAIETILKG